MRVLIVICMLLLTTNSNGQRRHWETKYWTTACRQMQSTWCVAACMEMTFGKLQCRFVSDWLRDRGYLTVNNGCCKSLSIGDICIEKAAIPGRQLTYLSSQFLPIQARFTSTWDFFDVANRAEVAYLAVRYTNSSHLMAIRRIIEFDENHFEISYVDPAFGNLRTISTYNDMDILF